MKTKKGIKKTALLSLVAFQALTIHSFAQTQIGADIDGEAVDFSGTSVSMPNSSTVAIGSPNNGIDSGKVRVYEWDGTNWIQKGLDIEGEAVGDGSGGSVSMPDPNTVAIGARFNDGDGNNAGHVRIYEWNGTAWVQKGIDLDGEAAEDQSGTVSMPNATTVAIGAPYNDGNGNNAGHVRIFEWSGAAWTQKGTDIDGEAAEDQSSYSVSMPDANIIAIGAIQNDGNVSNAGHVRVYEWDGTSWTQKGADIHAGDDIGDNSGYSVSMPDANIIAIGAPSNYSGINPGYVRIYSWDGSSWEQTGLDINGEDIGDNSGYSVSMPDASTIAIGARYNDGNGAYAGQVRVYTLSTAGVPDFSDEVILSVFPNPSTGLLTLQYNSESTVSYTVADITGKVILQGTLSKGTETIDLRQKEDGVYSLIVNEQIIRLVKE